MIREETTQISLEYSKRSLKAARQSMPHEMPEMPGKRLSVGNDQRIKPGRGGGAGT